MLLKGFDLKTTKYSVNKKRINLSLLITAKPIKLIQCIFFYSPNKNQAIRKPFDVKIIGKAIESIL
jgi:hypothetical protein